MNIEDYSYNNCWDQVLYIMLVVDHDVEEHNVADPNKASLDES